MHGSLYGAKLYDSARKKLVPVFGMPSGKAITFKKSDKTMIVAPMTLEARPGIYAVMPNSKRLGGFIPENHIYLPTHLQNLHRVIWQCLSMMTLPHWGRMRLPRHKLRLSAQIPRAVSMARLQLQKKKFQANPFTK